MICADCGADNRQGRKFCAHCGRPLRLVCSSCGAQNEAGEKFCGECGAGLGTPSSVVPAISEQSTTPRTIPIDGVSNDGSETARLTDGERRHLTVLFCDLVGSTEIAARLDPEEWRETVAGYHRAAAEEITRFGGHVAKYLGDGVMALFGYPEAHDNDGERAARAALAILEAIARLDRTSGRSKLSARVGIDSGAVVVGAGAGKDADVFGDAPNIAARVQAVAEPGTVMITEATQRLVSGLFVLEEHGAESLKGIERPVKLYRVARSSGVRGRLEAGAAVRGMTSFVGREDELRLLMNRWERVREGQGQVVTIVGEAGIGKSRLLQRFRAEIGSDSHTWLECATAPFYQNTPFYAVEELLRQSLHWDQRFAALEASLAAAGTSSGEAAPILPPARPLDLASSKAAGLTPEQERKRLLANLVGWTLDATRNQPLVIATEDLHWADPSTLELIQLMVEQGATSRLLLLYTARPEFRAQWPMRAHHTQITLNRLSAQSARAIIAEVMASKALAGETIEAVVERTGGVPLFVEELTRAVLEGGASLAGRAIPATLHDSLMARLDQLGAAKEIAQIGAVIGSEFSYELLRAVHPIADLEKRLRTLVDAELIYVRGIAPNATYRFKHALIRDAAYEALLKSRRKELHLRVGQAIEEKFPAIKEAQPEILARHWTEAGEIEAAIREWTAAAKSAESRNAFQEALDNYRYAISCLQLLPKSREVESRELELWQTVVRMLGITKGYSSRETIEATERAAELAEKSGDLAELLNFIVSKCSSAYMSGDLAAAGVLADRALAFALRDSSVNLEIVHGINIATRYLRGDLLGAEEHFTKGQRFFKDSSSRLPGNAATAFGVASWNAWTLGKADVARDRMAQMMAMTRTDNAYDVAFSRGFAAQLSAYMRDFNEAQVVAGQALELSEEHQFPALAALSRFILGYALAQLGKASEGIGFIRKGITDLNELGTRLNIGNSTTYLAAAEEREGSIMEALNTIERALQANPDELFYRPESLRVRGSIQLKLNRPDSAETDFRDSISLAQSMSAKSWELRATTSLARLLRDTNRLDEARMMLSEIYGWFTEGFDTADLKDAKSLLDDLQCQNSN
jgi:class 3 adenylate cyclase/tetratricopeptide (TPR) repeat protein